MSSVRSWSPAQQSAILARGENVIVSAGAGSGKTSVLVERVVQSVALNEECDLTELLVVTFTEAAAAEMRKRISDRLNELLQDAVHSGSEAQVRRFNRLIGQLNQAQISTLHSFCMQVVRQNYLMLNIEPGFGMLGEEDAVLLKTQCLKAVVEANLSAGKENALHAAMALVGTANPLKLYPLVFRLDTFSRSQARPVVWLERMRNNYGTAGTVSFDELPWTSTFATWCLRLLTDAVEDLEEAGRIAAEVPELESYAQNLEMVGPLVRAAVASAELRDWSSIVASLQSATSQKTPRAKDHPLKEHVTDLRKGALENVKEVLAILSRGTDALHQDVLALDPGIAALVDIVERFQTSYMEAKQESSVLDFNDLEHLAFEVLTDPDSGEAQRLQAQFAEIFVDEFQDTSPIQDALVAAIGRPSGNVFVVGDVKQSIYRFRMAEPSLFLNKYFGRVSGPAFRALHLSDNYRSRASVVSAVNHLFGQLFSEDFGGAPYDDEARMTKGAKYPDEPFPNDLSGSVEVHLLERDVTAEEGGDETCIESEDNRVDASFPKTSLDTDDESGEQGADLSSDFASHEDLLAIEREAHVIAQRISSFMGNDGSPRRQVWDAKRGEFRPLQYRDIVVLLRSVKGRMTPLLEVFRKYDIPSYGVTSTGFYGALEVQWLLAVLAVVDNPRREIELAAALRSPLGGFSDAELAEIRLTLRGNYYDALREAAQSHADEELRGKTRRFLQQVQSWRRLSRRASTEDVLARILADTGLLQYVSAMPGGRVRAANVHTLMVRARSFDKSSVDGVFGFVQHARQLLEYEIDLGEARTLAEAEDVVRVMTIHQSKGLEFPIVFVADLGKMFYRDALDRSLPLHRTMGFGPQRVDMVTDQRWRTVPSIAIEEAEKTEFLAEEARILYVAITRAREQLVLVGSARKLGERIARAARIAVATRNPYPARLLLHASSTLDWLLAALWRHPEAARSLLGALPQEAELGTTPSPVNTEGATYFVQVWTSERQGNCPFSRQEVSVPAVPGELLYPLRAALENGKTDEAYRILSRVESLETEADAGEDGVHETLSWVEDRQTDGPPAKVSATDLRRLFAARHRHQNAQRFTTRATAEGLLDDPVWVRERKVTGRERGLAFHAVMQAIDLSISPDAGHVQDELLRLVAERCVDEEQAAVCAVEDVVAFLKSPLGVALQEAKRVLREQPFFHRIDIFDISSENVETGSISGRGRTSLQQDFVTVQGVMDCLAELDDRWLLVDYKTDKIESQQVDETAMEYAAQISVYLEVAQALVGTDKPIEAWLYFVQPGVPTRLKPVDVRGLFASATKRF